MARTLADLDDAERRFLSDRHLASLTTLRRDGTPHVVAIAFTVDFESETVRVITSAGTQKVRNVEGTASAAVCQVDGGNWLSLEGPARVASDPESVAEAVAAYRDRYRPPSENPKRVVIQIAVERVLGRARI